LFDTQREIRGKEFVEGLYELLEIAGLLIAVFGPFGVSRWIAIPIIGVGLLLMLVVEAISRTARRHRHNRWVLSDEGRKYRQYETEIQAARQAFSLAEQAAKKAAEERRRQDLARTARSRELLLALSPQEFEQHVGHLFEALGYEVTLTPKSNDEGVDIYLKKDNRGAIVQCKRYTTAKVSRPAIQQLFGVLRHKRANEAFFVTTGEFSRQAREFAANKPIHLVDLEKLVQMADGAFTEEFIRSGPAGRINEQSRGRRHHYRYW